MSEAWNLPAGRTALVLGATGLVGGHCLDRLLRDSEYSRVRVIGRRPVDRIDPRLEMHVIDLDRMADHPGLFDVDDVFCCLGTTIRKAGSTEAFSRVDIEYPATAAALAGEAGADQFLVVSALGADPDSKIFYNRAKGEMEREVRQAPLRAIWIVRPALLLGERSEMRIGERVAEIVLRPIAPLMVGRLEKYRPVQASDVAAAMLTLARDGGTGGIIESDEIVALAR